MKTKLLALIVLVVLVWSSGSWASMVEVNFYPVGVVKNPFSLQGDGIFSGVSDNSLSQVMLWDSVLGNVSDQDGGWPSTNAGVTLGSHTADASTFMNPTILSGSVDPDLYLNPAAGRSAIGTSSAYSGDIQFTANTGGTFIAKLEMFAPVNLATDFVGDSASAYIMGRVTLTNDTTGASQATEWTHTFTCVDGNPFLEQAILQHLAASVDFTSGDIGSFSGTLYIQGDATSVVPLPGAVLLGILGMGTAGWRLRRHKMA